MRYDSWQATKKYREVESLMSGYHFSMLVWGMSLPG